MTGRAVPQALTRYWFATDPPMGYGVTASSREEALRLLREYGYPLDGQKIVSTIVGVKNTELDQHHVVPNAGPVVVRGIWYPVHNI